VPPEEEEEEEEEVEVEILGREEIVLYPRLGQPMIMTIITYSAAGLPPATIEIPKAEWTLEEEQRRIKEDVKRRLEFKPEVYTV